MNKIFKIVYYISKNNISIFRTLFFNFHYLPLAIAIKFPIIIYKSVRFKKTKGQIIINADQIKPGMLHIGKEIYGFQWKNDYTIWEQLGGTVVIEDEVFLGKGTFISVGENAVLRLEKTVHIGGDDRIICMDSITIKANTMVAWDVHIIDTDFRSTINTVFGTKNSEKKKIVIGRNNWLCFGCTILKGSVTPDFCIVGAKTLINRDFSNEGENILISAGDNSKIVTRYTRGDFSDQTLNNISKSGLITENIELPKKKNVALHDQ